MPCRCYVVPPHLLRSIAESSHNPDHIRKNAHASLAAHENVLGARKDRFAALTTPRGYQGAKPIHHHPQHIIPEHLLRHVAESDNVDDATRARAKRDLDHLQMVLASVKSTQNGGTTDQRTLNAAVEAVGGNSGKIRPYRAVYDAKHSSNQGQLPGKLVRAEGESRSKDKAVNDAYDNVGIVLKFYKDRFN
ncbi:Fc.00g061040.m01.CDS01 [Cosmosporella sp. VM-42]